MKHILKILHQTTQYTTLRIVTMFIMLVLSLNACQVDIAFDEEYNRNKAERYLCGYTWEEVWEDRQGYWHHSELCFYPDGSGEEYYWVESRWGKIVEEEYQYMKWNWTNHSYNSVRMSFRDGISYLEDLYWEGDWMYCLRDHVATEFRRLH